MAGSFVVERLLYPDLSIESRGTVILREFGPIRNENAAFFGFFRRNVGPAMLAGIVALNVKILAFQGLAIELFLSDRK